jgi:hypothetical protein
METLLAIVVEKKELTNDRCQAMASIAMNINGGTIYQTREYPTYWVFVLDKNMDSKQSFNCWSTRYDKPQEDDQMILIYGIKK